MTREALAMCKAILAKLERWPNNGAEWSAERVQLREVIAQAEGEQTIKKARAA